MTTCLELLPGSLSAEATDLDSLLDLSMEELVNLPVMTATKRLQKRSETPATLRVITRGEIESRGYFTLDEALADLPGMQFRNIQGFNSYIFPRGIPNQNNLTLVMIDGIQVNELNSGGFYGGGQYNLANVERIEVVYGPASALYGTHAVSGLINIITRDPESAQGAQASALIGNLDTRQYDLGYGYYDAARELGLRVSGMYKQSDKADLGGAAGDYNWSDAMDNFEEDIALDARLQYRALAVGFNLQDKLASRATNQKTLGTNLQDFGIDWHIRFLNVYAKFDYEQAQNWSWHSTLYFRDTTVEDDTLPVIDLGSVTDPGYQERWFRPNHLFGMENRLNYDLNPRQSFALGMVWERESLSTAGFSKARSASRDTPPPPPPDPDLLTNDLASLYAQLQWRLIDPFTLTVGARYDDSEVYGTVLTPRFGLVYNRDKLSAKLLYTEAYRAPKVWDYLDGLGNPDLAPEEMRSVELTAGYSFTETLWGEIAVYKNTLENTLTREVTNAGRRWVNIGGVDTIGLEANFEYRRQQWQAYLNYTYTDSTDDQGTRLAEIAPHSGNLGIQYAFTQRLKLHLGGQYLGSRRNPLPFTIGGGDEIANAFILHGALNLLDVHGLDFQLTTKNILDETYYHTSNTSVSRYRQPQFTVMFKVGVRLAP